MPRDNSTNPWADATNQAVGALYKYYMSQPTAADALKQKYMQAQMDRIGVQNEMDNRQMALGDYALPNLSPEIRNIMYRNEQTTPQAQQIFDAYVRPPMQIDAGDTKYIANGVTGLPIQEYGVGLPPERKIDPEGGQIINAPGVPAGNRPGMQQAQGSPMADLLGSVLGDNIPAITQDQMDAPYPKMNNIPQPMNPMTMGGILPVDEGDPLVTSRQQITGVNPNQTPQNMTVQQDGTTIIPLPKSPNALAKETKTNTQRAIQGDLVNDDIQRAISSLDGMMPVTGVIGSMTQGIPGTPAHNLEQTLTTIRANIGFDKLQAMREASPTGGALGQVSDFENTQLQAIYGSLAQSQSEPQFRYNLMRLYNTYNDIVHGAGNGNRYDIPTMEKVMNMQTPEELQGAMEFFNYDVPDDIESAIIQRANQLGL